MGDSLTADKLIGIWNTFHPILYYGVTKYCRPQEIIYVKKGKYNPEYIVIHPDDLEEVKKKITNRQLKPLSEYPSELDTLEYIETLRKECLENLTLKVIRNGSTDIR